MENEQARSIFQISLVRDKITIVLILKLIVVFHIKWRFFSDPLDLTQANNSLKQHIGLFNLIQKTNLNLEKTDG